MTLCHSFPLAHSWGQNCCNMKLSQIASEQKNENASFIERLPGGVIGSPNTAEARAQLLIRRMCRWKAILDFHCWGKFSSDPIYTIQRQYTNILSNNLTILTQKISWKRIKTDYWFYAEAIIVSEEISSMLSSYSFLVIVSFRYFDILRRQLWK